MHRVGRFSDKTARPIIVNFASYKKKQEVMSCAKKFKGSEYSVDQDYSTETRNVRKRLWEYAKIQEADKSKIKLKYDKLILNGKVFIWNKEKQVVVPAMKR